MASADVVLQAGHEGGVRNDGATGTAPSLGTAGVPGGPPERELTPEVCDTAAELLRAAGVAVIRATALYPERHTARLAVAVHFDGSSRPCASGASIGYPAGSPAGSNRPAADSWREFYRAYWPQPWQPDNFTAALRGYYGYGWVATADAELVLELGELTCPEQQATLVEWTETGYMGLLVASWVTHRLAETDAMDSDAVIARPPPFEQWLTGGDGHLARVLKLARRARRKANGAAEAVRAARVAAAEAIDAADGTLEAVRAVVHELNHPRG